MSAVLNKKRYSKLLGDALPHVIRNRKEHEEMLLKVEALMLRNKPLSREETELLELMTALIENWEQKKIQIERASPVETLRFLMESNEQTPKDLWHIVDKTALSRILSNRTDQRGISKEQARRLATFYHVSPAVFL